MSLHQEAPAAKLYTPDSWSFILSTLLLMILIAFEFFAVTSVLPVVTADLGGTGLFQGLSSRVHLTPGTTTFPSGNVLLIHTSQSPDGETVS